MDIELTDVIATVNILSNYIFRLFSDIKAYIKLVKLEYLKKYKKVP